MKKLKLQAVPVELPDDNYVENREFIWLAKDCSRGDGAAMWEMAQYFEQMYSGSGHPFFSLAANFWRYFAYLSGEPTAAVWLKDWEAEHSCPQIPAVMDERRSGKDVDGGIFRCLGFRFFKRGVIYDVHPTGNLGVTYVCVHPHEDGTFEGAHYEHTYLDEYLNPLPIASVYFHPDNRAEGDALAEHLFPLLRKALLAAYKRNEKKRESSTFFRCGDS